MIALAFAVTNTVLSVIVLAFTQWSLGVVAALCYFELVVLYAGTRGVDGSGGDWAQAGVGVGNAIIVGWCLQKFRGLNLLEAVGFQTLTNVGVQAIVWAMGV